MHRRRVFLIAAVVVAVVLLALGAATLLLLARPAAAPPSAQPAAEAAPVPVPEAAQKTAAAAPPPAPLVVEKDGVKRVSCAGACGLEDRCGFRAAADCRSASCDGDVRKVNRSDFCLDGADTCADAAACPCDEACWRRGECAGDHANDKACTAACVNLVKQDPKAVYVENRCVLESACADLAVCGAVAR